MQLNSASSSQAHLRRANPELQAEDQPSYKASIGSAQQAPQLLGSIESGERLQIIGDTARDAFHATYGASAQLADDVHGDDIRMLRTTRPGDIDDVPGGTRPPGAGMSRDEVAELFESVDIDNPTLETTQGGFDVSASQGLEDSTYIDLGNGAGVFVVRDPITGNQAAYRVEDGELGERIPADGSTHVGNGIYVSVDADDAQIHFQQGRTSVFNLRPPTMSLNSDNSMLTIRNRQGSSVIDYFRGSEVNSFDIQSGTQVVTDGVADVDNMTAQQQFDYYASTPEGQRILQIEGDHYSRDVEKRLFVARVRYAREEGGPELFNEFTPRRAGLSGADLVEYDAAVQDMMNEIRDQGVYTVDGEPTDDRLDESLLYIVAASAVEAYGESPEAMDAIKEDITEWHLSTDNADGVEIVTDSGSSFSAGWYRRGENPIVQFSINSLVNDFVQPDDNFELVTHELAHSLDHVDGDVFDLDGIPPGLTDEQIEILIAERERLFELAYPGEDIDISENQDHNTVADNSGFRNYTFRNEREFWAELTATFLGSDAGAETVREASPELYDMLREYYGRDDLPASDTFIERPPIDIPLWPTVPGPGTFFSDGAMGSSGPT